MVDFPTGVFEIILNDTYLEPISTKQNIENALYNFCENIPKRNKWRQNLVFFFLLVFKFFGHKKATGRQRPTWIEENMTKQKIK